MTLLMRREPEIVERIAPLLIRPLEMVKRKAVESAMILCQGDEVEAAKRLGISRSGIRKMLAKYREVDECLA
jgi:DNA-binding NtrC family response regulator